MQLSTSDFRMTFSKPDFEWYGSRFEGIPIIRLHTGRIFLPSLFYFCYSAEEDRVDISSMGTEAYALREWLAFLTNRNRCWDAVDDYLLHQWRQQQLDSTVVISEHQIERKLSIVYQFYKKIRFAMPIAEDGSQTKSFVGGAKATEFFPISSKIVRHEGKDHEVWRGHRYHDRSIEDPTVPDDAQVGLVLQELRTPKANCTKPGSNRREPDIYKPDRDWLMGCSMAKGGLRASEVSELTTKVLTKALKEEGILSKLPDHWRNIESIAALADSPSGQEIVLTELKKFQRSKHREYIFVMIDGKGGKGRKAPFLIDLVRDLLIIGIWGVRDSQIKSWGKNGPTYDVDDAVFLSTTTQKRLTPGAVSDIMFDAFLAAKVAGSGHDLRKFYATKMAIMIMDRTLSSFQGQPMYGVMSTVMTQVMSALGHSKVDTTVLFYVNMAQIHHAGLKNRGKRNDATKIWNYLLDNQEIFTELKIGLIFKIVKTIAELEDQHQFVKVLGHLINDKSLNPVKLASPPKQVFPRLAFSREETS